MSDVIFDTKKEKFLELREKGSLADHFPKTHTTAQALALPEGTIVSCAGRVVGQRTMGKILFAHLYDLSGKMQICVRKTEESPEVFETWVNDVSIGDFIGCEGELFVTKTGELTIRVSSFKLLNKCLRTLPEKYHGIEDIEARYRQRYLDLIMNPDTREVFQKRMATVRSLRHFLENNDFLEVETPIIQTQASGAMARTFNSHHNALDIDCVLRIAPETYLKRLVGGGFDKVFEFARCFRNEGVSATHLQDFTMLEFYAAYWNADIMRDFVAKMIRNLVDNVFGKATVSMHGHDVDFSGEWPVHDFSELILKDCGIDIRNEDSPEKLLKALKSKNIHVDDMEKLSWANLADGLYKKVSRPKLIQPCFLVKYPAEMCPLARRNSEDRNFIDMFQFVVVGVELVKAYSELVDAVDQRERLICQSQAKQGGDVEAMEMDEDYLLAMEHGFPPIAGVGVGIDRLVMVLTGCDNIKDTVLFPLLRPVSE